MRSRFLGFAHVLIGKPVRTFPGHAPMIMCGWPAPRARTGMASTLGYPCLRGPPWKDCSPRSLLRQRRVQDEAAGGGIEESEPAERGQRERVEVGAGRGGVGGGGWGGGGEGGG